MTVTAFKKAIESNRYRLIRTTGCSDFYKMREDVNKPIVIDEAGETFTFFDTDGFEYVVDINDVSLVQLSS